MSEEVVGSKKPLVISSLKFLLLSICCLSTFLSGLSWAQDSIEVTPELLNAVFPAATHFSEKQGNPLVRQAFQGNEDQDSQLLGYLFETSDLPPEEIGYSAPINVLVGMDLSGELTGIQVLYYRESYKSIRGDFLATERFPNQFESKNIVEGFRVGRDIDGVSRATVTSWAVARGIRNAGRRVAQAYMNDSQVVSGAAADAVALEILAAKSWQELKQDGLVLDFSIPHPESTSLELDLIFLGHDGLGELILGVNDYSLADREASSRVTDGNMLLVGIDGNASLPFRQERLAVEQNGERFRISRNRFVYAGSADEGMIANQVRFAGALVLDPAIDLAESFTVLYDMSENQSEFERFESANYRVPPLALALARGEAIPAEYLPPVENDFNQFEEEGVFAGLINNAPWVEVIALLVLFGLVMTSFLKKHANQRWLTLAYTMLYLGFYDGGFVSVSHITNGLKLGPSMFLTDLPLLLIIIFTAVTTLFWGRVFCSSLCPFGAVQDFITRVVPKRFQVKVPQGVHDWAIYIKYGVLGLLIVMALTFSNLSLFQYFEPFGTLFYFSQSLVLWLILTAFLLGSVFIPRFYCRYACPLGASLGVVSIISPFKIKRVAQCDICKVCEHACPTAAIRGPDIDFKECVRCDLCEIKLIARSGVCKHDMEEVKIRVKDWQPSTA